MAVKLQRTEKQVKEEVVNELKEKGLTNEGVAVVKMLQRFDMIQTYVHSIGEKVDNLYNDICANEGNNPLLILHIKTINQLLVDIEEQIELATTEDIKPTK